jgi:hypothetical protein
MSQILTASFKYEDIKKGRFYILQRALMKLDKNMESPYRIKSAELDSENKWIYITAKTD